MCQCVGGECADEQVDDYCVARDDFGVDQRLFDVFFVEHLGVLVLVWVVGL